MKRVTQSMIICMIVSIFCHCSNSSASVGSDIFFSENRALNEGSINQEVFELKRNLWRETFSPGDTLEEGVHYTVDRQAIPEGLDFYIRLISKSEAEMVWTGKAVNHHPNDKTQVALSLKKEALLGNTEKVFTRSPKNYVMHINFGKGYQLGGTFDASEISGTVQVREMSTGEVLILSPNQSKFEFTKVLEQGEPFTLQIEKIDPDYSCSMDRGDGQIGKSDIKDIHIECHLAQWEDPSSMTKDLSNADVVISSNDLDSKASLAITNEYGDVGVVWQANQNGQATAQKYVSMLHANSKKWTHPTQPNSSNLLSLSLSGDVDANMNVTKSKDMNLLLYKYTADQSEQNLYDWFGQSSQLFQKLSYQPINQPVEAFLVNRQWKQTLYRKSLQQKMELEVREIDNQYQLYYHSRKNFNLNTGTYRELNSTEIDALSELNYISTGQRPYFKGEVNQNGKGFLLWVKKNTQDNYDNTLWVLNINSFHTQTPSIHSLRLSNHKVIGEPVYKMNEHGDIVIVWLELNPDETKTIHRATRSSGSNQWYRSTPNPFYYIDPIKSDLNSDLEDEVFFQLTLNNYGDYAVMHESLDTLHSVAIYREGVWFPSTPIVSSWRNQIGNIPSGGVTHADGILVHFNDQRDLLMAIQAASDVSSYGMVVVFNADQSLLPLDWSNAFALPSHQISSNLDPLERAKLKGQFFDDGSMTLFVQNGTNHPQLKTQLWRYRYDRLGNMLESPVNVVEQDEIQVIGKVELIDMASDPDSGSAMALWQAETTLGSVQQVSVRR